MAFRGGTLVFGLLAWLGSAGHSAEPAPSANAAMEARLRAIYAATDWKGDPTTQAERARYFTGLVASGRLSAEQLRVVYPQLANELLRAGDPSAALRTLAAWERVGSLPPAELTALHTTRAVAFLRLGEQQNCVGMAMGGRACVFPLRGAGVHTRTEGAEGAVRELTWLLDRHQDEAIARWLLNVAYMQLGLWPAAVPPKWLLDGKLFRGEAPFGEFPEVAAAAGLDVMGRAGGAAVEDFTGDGRLDVALSSSGPLDPMHLLRNKGDGHFEDVTAQAGLEGELGGLNLVVADYDGDGRPDLLVLRGGWWGRYGEYPVSLLRNTGGGRFEDVTERSGLIWRGPAGELEGAVGPTQTAAWADYDGDGRLDLFIGREPLGDAAASGGAVAGGASGQARPSLLFHNNGDGTFTEVGQACGLAAGGFVKGVAWGDFNQDGRPDLYLSTHDGHNHLFRNDGPADPAHPDPRHWRFTDVTAAAGLTNPGPTFATWFFDYNNDGWPDLFVAGYWADSMEDVGRFEAGEPFKAGVPHLYRNNGDGTFTDVSHAVGLDRAVLPMGANFGDLDNDGWLDIYLGTGEPSFQALLPNRMFRNTGGTRFADVTTPGGFGHLQKGHAVVFADLGNRGQEDVFEEMGGAFPGDGYTASLYRNPGHPGHWVTLRLEGTRSNRAAFGARIEVDFRENGHPRRVFRTVGAVSSFGAGPAEQHIGLGTATAVDAVKVRWPATWPREETLHGLAVDRVYHLREGAGRAEPVERKPLNLAAR